MILPGSYANGFAPRDGRPLYPSLWRDCVGAWAPCLGPTGLTLRDWSGFANHGTVSGGAGFAPNFGRYSLELDGSNDFVEMPAISRIQGVTQLTLLLWASFDTSRTNGLFSYGTSGGDTNDIFIYTSAGVLRFQINNGADTRADYTVSLSRSNLTCVVMRFDGNGATNADREQVFVNGNQVSLSFIGNVPISTASPPNARMRVGDYYSFPGGWNALGSISQVAIWTRFLSNKEISLVSLRPGIAHELAPRRRSALVAGFNRRRRLLVGAGS
jgi:hypothetical protein